MKHRILVAYYSHSGNTKFLAEAIRAQLDADIIEIIPQTPYAKKYSEIIQQVKEEIQTDAIVSIVTPTIDISSYDVIFLGTPVWWYTLSGPLKTFIQNYNFKGKVIVPFCTHGGGGEADTFKDINSFTKGAKHLSGISIYNRSFSISEVSIWLENISKKFHFPTIQN